MILLYCHHFSIRLVTFESGDALCFEAKTRYQRDLRLAGRSIYLPTWNTCCKILSENVVNGETELHIQRPADYRVDDPMPRDGTYKVY